MSDDEQVSNTPVSKRLAVFEILGSSNGPKVNQAHTTGTARE